MTDEQKEKIFDAILNAERNDAVIVHKPFAIEVLKDYWSNDKGPFDNISGVISVVDYSSMYGWGAIHRKPSTWGSLSTTSGTITQTYYQKEIIRRIVHFGEYLDVGRYGRDIINSIRDKSLHCKLELVDNDFMPGCHEEPQGSRWVRGSCCPGCRVVTFVYWTKAGGGS